MYGESQERMTQPAQAIVPDTERYQLPEAETASVYPARDHDYHDPIMAHGTQHIRRELGR